MNINYDLIVNVVAIAYFAGVYTSTQKNQKESIENLKKDFENKFENLKQDFQARFDKVEKKQDKHNNLIERMVRVEDSTKSAHKRLDVITGVSYDR